MARDFLAIHASGVGVERLFNSARDICHYRRGRLEHNTIEKLMLQLATGRFLVKEEYHCMEEYDEEDSVEQRDEC